MARRRPRTPRPSEADSDVLSAGLSESLLKALHILTPDGRINQDSRRKLKQVQHLVQMLSPALDRVAADGHDLLVADMGAGKSYLGLILYDLVLSKHEQGSLLAIEARADLTASARSIADQSGFNRTRFITAPIASETADAALQGRRPAMVTALHACDTATDDAIRFALRHDARTIALVPCCQAEAAALLGDVQGPLEALWRHPIQRRAFGAQITNTIRALVLEANGYKVRMTEFTGFEHTQKNELILAERVQRSNAQARAQLDRLLAEVPVKIGLLETLA